VVAMTIAAVVERLGWQAQVSNIAAKNQQIPGEVIKVQVSCGFFFFLWRSLCF